MLTLLDSQQVTVRIAGAADAAGNPVDVGSLGARTWSCSDPSIVDLTPAPDGASCLVTTKGPLGRVVVSVAAALPGGENLRDDFGIEVTADVAKTLNLVADPPVARASPVAGGVH